MTERHVIDPKVFALEICLWHIADGKPNEPFACPISLALREQYPFLSQPCVTPWSFGARLDGQGVHFRLSRAGRNFIEALDAGGRVGPCRIHFRQL